MALQFSNCDLKLPAESVNMDSVLLLTAEFLSKVGRLPQQLPLP